MHCLKYVSNFDNKDSTIKTVYKRLITMVANWAHFRSKGHIPICRVTMTYKGRPGSIVTKTLKNGILIPIATSKESHFNADFKYISFIKFSLTHQKLRA